MARRPIKFGKLSHRQNAISPRTVKIILKSSEVLSSPWSDICNQIQTFARDFTLLHLQAIGGGCINDCYHIRGSHQAYFVKLNDAGFLPFFEAEAAGLMEIHNSQTIRVPQPLCYGCNTNHAWLVLEYIELGHTKKKTIISCLEKT